jgi:hypothetical protein
VSDAHHSGNGGAPEPGEGRNLPVLAERPSDALEPEVVDGRVVEPAPAGALPAPVIAAAGGLVAGFATVVLARLLRARSHVRLGRRGRRTVSREIAGSRSFLVDVHVLRR